ncbi:MAG: DUF5056 domain-containing protein [Clostridium sp.]|nr:DUF5056 domain-containing protein [Clostridium sp.]
MTNRDELLVKQFLNEQTPTKPDNGFTQRVMQTLSKQERPYGIAQLNSLWTIGCLTLVICIWLMTNGWNDLTQQFQIHLRTFIVQLPLLKAALTEFIHSNLRLSDLQLHKYEWAQLACLLMMLTALYRHEARHSK